METFGTSQLLKSNKNLKIKFTISIAMLLLGILAVPRDAKSAGDESRLSVFADCHCTDPVGLDFCSDFKTKVKDSASYRLVERPDALGIGVHFWCLDLWNGLPGIDKTLTGTMSAVSVVSPVSTRRLRAQCRQYPSHLRSTRLINYRAKSMKTRRCSESAKTPRTRCRDEFSWP